MAESNPSSGFQTALRALSAFGVFRELSPGTFANSEASSLFRDGAGPAWSNDAPSLDETDA